VRDVVRAIDQTPSVFYSEAVGGQSGGAMWRRKSLWIAALSEVALTARLNCRSSSAAAITARESQTAGRAMRYQSRSHSNSAGKALHSDLPPCLLAAQQETALESMSDTFNATTFETQSGAIGGAQRGPCTSARPPPTAFGDAPPGSRPPGSFAAPARNVRCPWPSPAVERHGDEETQR